MSKQLNESQAFTVIGNRLTGKASWQKGGICREASELLYQGRIDWDTKDAMCNRISDHLRVMRDDDAASKYDDAYAFDPGTEREARGIMCYLLAAEAAEEVSL